MSTTFIDLTIFFLFILVTKLMPVAPKSRQQGSAVKSVKPKRNWKSFRLMPKKRRLPNKLQNQMCKIVYLCKKEYNNHSIECYYLSSFYHFFIYTALMFRLFSFCFSFSAFTWCQYDLKRYPDYDDKGLHLTILLTKQYETIMK